MKADFVIVGSGLTGAVMARHLVDAGEKVIMLERRPHLGGNVADYAHASGVNVHRYGPHLFRTVSDEIWRFVNRFATFHPYEHKIRSVVEGQLENWPIAASYIRRMCGESWRPEFTGTPANFEEAALSMMPRVVYENFVKGYSEKQWGVPAVKLSAKLCKRFDVRADDDPRLTPHHKYQGIPTEGYSKMMERMLTGVPVMLGFDFLKDRDAFKARKQLIFTGPIDEFFNFELGKLAYRGQKRATTYVPDVDWKQPCGQLNSPRDGDHIRDIEWKHMMRPDYAARIRGTVLTREVPWTPNSPEHYEYPFPDDKNQELFEQYQMLANEEAEKVLICGRLGEYRYYDMDHAIGRAMTLVKKVLAGRKTPGLVTTPMSE
jgi:UDP-galactopyranose mutase